MNNRMQQASEWLAAKRLEQAGVKVTYRRKRFEKSNITAAQGQSQFNLVNDTGAAVQQVQHFDWLIAPADLVLEGKAVEPAAGDVIVTAAGEEYRVTPPVPGQPAWRWNGQFKTLYRIHTKRDK